MSQQGLWKAGETTALLETSVHDVGIVLDYMPTGHNLFLKEIHQHCLQTWPFTQQHVFTNNRVPNVVLSPREYRNKSGQWGAMCYLIAEVTTKKRTEKKRSSLEVSTCRCTHSQDSHTQRTRITIHGVIHSVIHCPSFYWVHSMRQHLRIHHREQDRPGPFSDRVYSHGKGERQWINFS